MARKKTSIVLKDLDLKTQLLTGVDRKTKRNRLPIHLSPRCQER